MNRYSQLYERGETLAGDSQRMRKRFLIAIEEYFPGSSKQLELAHTVERECGIDIIRGCPKYADWNGLLRHGELRDVFDTLSFAFEIVPDVVQTERFRVANRKAGFRDLCSRIFDEEMVAYSMDENAIVHPKVDEAFEVARRSLIAGLSRDGFGAAREHLEAVDRALLQTPSDGRAAIRSIFDVVENIFKQRFPGVTHVNSTTLKSNLRSDIEAKFVSDKLELLAALKLFEGLVSWVNAVHFYRHEAGQPQPNQPSEMTTLAIVSQGYSQARWLLEITSD